MENPEHYKAIARRSFLKNKERIYARFAKYAQSHKKEMAEYQKAWRAKNKLKIKKYMREYAAKNKDSIRSKQRDYLNRKLKTNPTFRLQFYLRSIMREAIRGAGTQKADKTLRLLGCSMKDFRAHLQSQFTPQMTWNNYGSYWVVDHISPVSAFDLTKPDQQRLAFHYSNCRPLEKSANQSKGDQVLQMHELMDV